MLGSDKMKVTLRLGFFSLGILILLVGLTACGTVPNEPIKQESQATLTDEPDNEVSGGEGTAEEKNGRVETKTFTIYYTDEQLLEIHSEEQSIQFTTEKELHRALWYALQRPTKELNYALWGEISLLEIRSDRNNLIIDISVPDGYHIGTSGEALAIQTLIQTLGQVDNVETIQILIDGEVAETLAGHVGIEQPFPKDVVIYKGE
jgi:hypothetical protein